MKTRTWITALLLAALVALTAVAVRDTRDLGPLPPEALAQRTSRRAKATAKAKAKTPGKDKAKAAPAPPGVALPELQVDQRPFLTARQLSRLAWLPEEQALARQALRLGNHEVDLAFADAVRTALENPPELTEELMEIQIARDRAEGAVQFGQKRVKQLTERLATATGDLKGELEDQLELTKAQLELDQDEMEEAQEDLERAGGDPTAKIRRLKEARAAAEKEEPAVEAEGKANPFLQEDSLIGRFRAWRRLHRKDLLLEAAQQEALDKAAELTQRKDKLTQALAATREAREAARDQAAGLVRRGATHSESREAVSALKRFSEAQRHLTNLAKRIQDQRDLADTYGRWGLLVEVQDRAERHGLYKGLLVILSTLLGVFLLGTLVDRLFLGMARERAQVGTLRAAVKFAVQGIGALVILFTLVGLPSQATTILGLAGAGLTVALKDFIVAFFGWFILMGRNGIRVGDWVEIKGVGGEVVEIGMLRTVLLETGSWSDAGHPTGRRVAFVNSFAMEGHFFNFTTSGQWMWDEVKVLVPPGADPYPVLEGVQKLVDAASHANAAQAEAEWRESTSRYRVQAFNAAPGLQVVPTQAGVEIRARYLTRANERHRTRTRLYEDVVALMHGKGATP